MNILTFDLEDWFHILDFKDTAYPAQWMNFESRVEANTERILQLLEKKKLTATFFCLGWIAEKYPALVRKISVKHEIACHSMNHQLLYLNNKAEFKEDLNRSLSILESLTGKKVVAYRAPGFSLSREHGYVFEELENAGIKIDSSVFPAARNHGGIADFPFQKPCLMTGPGYEIVEFPINTKSFLKKQLIFSGGGYFRLLPYPLIRKWMKESDYVMTYFHPRDFDPDQPQLRNLSIKRRFMSYTGLKTSEMKLEKLLSDFQFISLEQAFETLNTKNLPVVSL
ncbi:MAG: polysaccharide deacetylase family protein [Bacteroidetes bacterium]|nr:polysaccharide deacetylase family protein [Bacteroidota bacterium]